MYLGSHPSPANKTSFWRKSTKGKDAPARSNREPHERRRSVGHLAMLLDKIDLFIDTRGVGRGAEQAFTYYKVARKGLSTIRLIGIGIRPIQNTHKTAVVQVWSSLLSRIWQGAKICVSYRCTVPILRCTRKFHVFNSRRADDVLWISLNLHNGHHTPGAVFCHRLLFTRISSLSRSRAR